MKWLVIIICWLTLLGGCLPSFAPPQYYYTHQTYLEGLAPVRDIPVYLDKSFTQQEQMDLQRAIDQWNFALNGRVKITIAATDFDMGIYDIHQAIDHRGWIIHKIHQDNLIIPAGVVREDGNLHQVCAWVDHLGGTEMWIISERIQETWVFSIAMHEIGHLLGAEHQGNLLMSPSFNMYKYQCVDQGTMTQVIKYLGLDMSQVNYCTVEN